MSPSLRYSPDSSARSSHSSEFDWRIVTTGAFISGPPNLQFDLPEWLTVVCALVFAVHILVTDRVAKRSPPLAVTWSSFVWVTAMSLVLLVILMNRAIPLNGLTLFS